MYRFYIYNITFKLEEEVIEAFEDITSLSMEILVFTPNGIDCYFDSGDYHSLNTLKNYADAFVKQFPSLLIRIYPWKLSSKPSYNVAGINNLIYKL